MAVYVDDYRGPFRNMRMSHLTADTEAELHAMADRLGLSRAWFQAHPRHPHYDVCEPLRRMAIRFGAVAESAKDGARRRKG